MEQANNLRVPLAMGGDDLQRFLKWRYKFIPTQLWRLKNKEIIKAKENDKRYKHRGIQC